MISFGLFTIVNNKKSVTSPAKFIEEKEKKI
jgi:hypothetical protein